ncbi:bifunctional phosphopantothenoylcysteine decarboxylase/phosphopantothenate--cysteine ligase CoaBC [Magnetospira sp. QH-2]|uniref:bifunctional phosphopantothenoylcysteine decarboxylase/phosphopantothenate--cysteine ligase CoaBC n=1 Tax=Magnetospira sp. (strain QH-2) TaxID=1288970 RepID=UPI0003E818B2|nr:bifunctional phosphopantothenoylcysteine decarboxylase/phosphopantothenate--cysteine ligase CoaBC [Magnetospira sp. QH-2]CCQ75733.1 Coenzyme A biosynthesis bifunctional protein coaBC [phosphopantothenoylcysteine synthetase/decarboxylase] [Magnetospira sp. QH-2]
MFDGKQILLVVAGGIAAYKSLELVRLLKAGGARVRCLLTRGGEQFVTPLSLAALSGEKVYQDLFSLTDEQEMGHIRLAREPDLVIVAPTTADLMARLRSGRADDLACAVLLATDKPVLLAPAMNVRMWENPATMENLSVLEARGFHRVGPGTGDMACGEWGEGRMAEPAEILEAAAGFLADRTRLAGRHAIVTSGPTHEPIDPVRYIANRSSGKQGHAVAAALADLGARVTLISGPVRLSDPRGVAVTHVESAEDMLQACTDALPADVAVCAAAVADWKIADAARNKIKKQANGAPPSLALTENPDILASLSAPGATRPALVVGFAAETENLLENARRKLARKGCDWLVANDVSPATGTFGGDRNQVHLMTRNAQEDWPTMDKTAVARALAGRIADALEAQA